MNTIINYILKLIPLIGFLLIGSGFVKLMIYYKAFRIRIFDFIDLQEIILSFTDNLIGYFCILTLTFGTGFIFYYDLETSGLTIDTLKNIEFLERLFIYIKVNLFVILIIIILNIGAILFWKLRKNIFGYEAIFLIVFLWLSLFISPIIINEIRIFNCGNIYLSPDFGYLILVMSTLSLIFYVIGSAYNEINKVKRHFYFKGSEFFIGNKKIESTENYYYIGQTKKYIFFTIRNLIIQKFIPYPKSVNLNSLDKFPSGCSHALVRVFSRILFSANNIHHRFSALLS